MTLTPELASAFRQMWLLLGNVERDGDRLTMEFIGEVQTRTNNKLATPEDAARLRADVLAEIQRQTPT